MYVISRVRDDVRVSRLVAAFVLVRVVDQLQIWSSTRWRSFALTYVWFTVVNLLDLVFVIKKPFRLKGLHICCHCVHTFVYLMGHHDPPSFHTQRFAQLHKMWFTPVRRSTSCDQMVTNGGFTHTLIRSKINQTWIMCECTCVNAHPWSSERNTVIHLRWTTPCREQYYAHSFITHERSTSMEWVQCVADLDYQHR